MIGAVYGEIYRPFVIFNRQHLYAFYGDFEITDR